MMLLAHIVIAGLGYSNSAAALTAFQPNCTLPPDGVHFVSGTQLRGTIEIAWSSLAVLLLCTWAVQHLAVPLHKEEQHTSPLRAFFQKTRFHITKFKWMLVSFLAPEFVLGKAVAEHIAAHDSFKQFNDKDWTTTHGYFANMRGFVLRFEVAAARTSLEPSKPKEIGRSLMKTRSVEEARKLGGVPYFEQDARRAEGIELVHCGKFCKDYPDAHLPEKLTSPAPITRSSITKAKQDGLSEVRVEGQKVPNALPSPLLSPPIASPSIEQKVIDTRQKRSISPPTTPLTPWVDTPKTLVNRLTFPSQNPAGQASETENSALLPPTPSTPNPEKRPMLVPHKSWPASWPLNSLQMYHAYQNGLIPHDIPLPTRTEINDKSKGDFLVKGAAVVQILWLVIQIIVRAGEGMAVTLLEITVLAFAACAIVIYILIWHKPQDVQVPIYIDAARKMTRQDVIELAARSHVSTMIVHEFWLHGVAIRTMADNIFPWTPGLKIKFPRSKEAVYFNPIILGIGIGGVIFGAIHFVAWNFVFPTRTEQLLWRIACIVLVSFPFTGTMCYVVMQHAPDGSGTGDNQMARILRPMAYMIVPFYMLARFYLLTEVFRSLAYLPPSAFQDVNWPTVIPHVS